MKQFIECEGKMRLFINYIVICIMLVINYILIYIVIKISTLMFSNSGVRFRVAGTLLIIVAMWSVRLGYSVHVP